MPRRKISIEDALRVLEEAGVPLQAKPVETVAQPQKPTVSPAFAKKSSSLPTVVKMTLFARHSVGSGGNLTVVADGEKAIEHAGVQTYGPGICHVPVALAPHLAHADTAAKQADERMLERVQRNYIVAERRTPDGYLRNVAIEVNSDMFAESPFDWPSGFQHIIR